MILVKSGNQQTEILRKTTKMQRDNNNHKLLVDDKQLSGQWTVV